MSGADLKSRDRAIGALGKASLVRVDDVVGRGFAQRLLVDEGRPAQCLKLLMQAGCSRSLLRHLILIYTCRANPILRDFLRDVYWRKVNSGVGEVSKQDTRDFLEHAVALGLIKPRWSDNMMERGVSGGVRGWAWVPGMSAAA